MGSWGLSPYQRKALHRLASGWTLGFSGIHGGPAIWKGSEVLWVHDALLDALLRKGIVHMVGDYFEITPEWEYRGRQTVTGDRYEVVKPETDGRSR